MSGFTPSTNNSRSYIPCSYTVSENSKISALLRRIFKGHAPTSKQEWKDEKPYHHVPTHARTSFMKTATNPSMLGPHLRKANQEPNVNEGVEDRQSSTMHGSLI